MAERRARREAARGAGAGATALELARASRLHPLLPGGEADAARVDGAPHALEIAWDGERVVACKAGAEVRLFADGLRERTDLFPSVAAAIRAWAPERLVVEGWVTALDDAGRPSFDALRAHVRGGEGRFVFAPWDLHRVDDEELRGAPLAVRLSRLGALLDARAGDPALVRSQRLPGRVAEVLGAARALGVRGVIARPTGGAIDGPEPWLAFGTAGPIALARELSPPPKVTNADKVLFPRDGFTKRDVVDFYAGVADAILPHMRGRPVVAQRWPDGIDDFTWYQHRPPPRAPDYLKSYAIDGDRRIAIEGRDALLWLVNQAALTFHGWTSRAASLEHPDWVLIDLDPGEATTWEQTLTVAQVLRKLLETLGLPSVPKTSGQKGLHVLIPLAPGQDRARANELGGKLAAIVARVLPETVTMELARERRRGRLFLDTQQGFVGKTLVLPYSLRAADGAPASTPLAWDEVGPGLDPRAWNLRTLRARLDAKGDLAAPLLAGTLRLDDALAKVG